MSCTLGKLKATFGALLGPEITAHCLGVSAGLFQGREREEVQELWDSDLGFEARREFS